MQQISQIAIVGGGNMGSALAADIAQRYDVSILTNHPERWSASLVSEDTDSGTIYHAHLKKISKNPKSVIPNADVVIITLPAFCREQAISQLEPYLKCHSILCFMPGTGGIEFYVEKLLQKGITVVGFDRVTHVARVSEYGKTVSVAKKKHVRFCTLGCQYNHIENLIRDVFAIQVTRLTNYLSVTFTPSNPILHTSRLYDIWFNKPKSHVFDKNPLFYAEWSNLASEILLGCDDELQAICTKINSYNTLPSIETIFLREHYESRNTEELTKKLNSINSLSKIESPLVKTSDGFVLDSNSRYFQEDFPYGLQILIAFAEKFGVSAPSMHKINEWFKTLSISNCQKSRPVTEIEKHSVDSLLQFYKTWQ